jgi:hypothetical protein
MDTISKICFVEKKLGEIFEDQFLKNTYQFSSLRICLPLCGDKVVNYLGFD